MSSEYDLKQSCFNCNNRCVGWHTSCIDLLFYNVFHKKSYTKNNVSIRTVRDDKGRHRDSYKRRRIHREYLKMNENKYIK